MHNNQLLLQEAFEYMGSVRTLYDMKKGRYPYKLTDKKRRNKDRDETLHRLKTKHIGSYIELAQLGLLDEDSLWMHTDPRSREDASIDSEVRVEGLGICERGE